MSNWSDNFCSCGRKKSSVFTICKFCIKHDIMKYDICFCGGQKLKWYSTCKKCHEGEKKLLEHICKKQMIWPDNTKPNMQEDNFYENTIPKCFSCSSYGRSIKHFAKDCPKQQKYKNFSYELNHYGGSY
ncbi:4137_t:CDS:1 [Scutellospora calospora]|uniref:4137_t:CDS:1 n=1 Tax=Scutellospora calospora TaxID=85575 RepID=A0ACA9NLI1_9GLOM|nr:4137_t:CDS:1 [Scutellospora calospora]